MKKPIYKLACTLSRRVLARFEYRAYFSRNLKAKQCVSDRLLVRFAHRGWCYGVNRSPGPCLTLLVLQRTSAIFSVDGSILKLLKRPTVGLPPIPLSLGSKLELLSQLSELSLCQIPYTSLYLSSYTFNWLALDINACACYMNVVYV